MKYLIAAIVLVVFSVVFAPPAQAHTSHHTGEAVETEQLAQELHRLQIEVEIIEQQMRLANG